MTNSGVIRAADAEKRIPGPAGEHAVSLVQRGTLEAKYAIGRYAPPREIGSHDKDEIYVIVRGSGVLYHGGRRDPFSAGDLLYVAAGVEHRFEETSEDLAVWVVFYGPAGGERP